MSAPLQLVASFALATLLAALVGPAPAACGFFHLTREQLTAKLADASLAPGKVHKYIKRCGGKDALTLNGVGARDLLGLNHIKIQDCDHEVVLERVALCKRAEEGATAASGGFASVAGYCRDRVAKLIGECAKEIDVLTEECLFEVQPRDLDVIRKLLKSHMAEPESHFKEIVDEYLAPHEFDMSEEKKRAALAHSCDQLTQAFKPIRVILDHEAQFGVPATKSDVVSNWSKAYNICEFYYANYKQ